jgi:phospholipid/cholesterol/gamma-HCH transport system substrate-binding protein
VTAIRKHLRDFLAIIALFVIGMGVAAYILANERFRFPFFEEKPFVVKVEIQDAQAVTPGQGQTFRVAGVEIGQIGQVTLEDGIAVVDAEIEQKYKGLLRKDATVLLRPKTGLKDMFFEADPGKGEPLEENERIQLANTAPDIDPDEFLSALDADTRDYLKLLISGAGKGLKGHGDDFREVLKRLEPLHRDIARVTTAIAERRSNLRRLVHNYGLLTEELGKKDNELTRLVVASNQVFQAFASEDQNVSAFVAKLPASLRQTESTLRKVDRFADVLGPSLESLRPAFRRLDEANRAVLPFVREAEPIVRTRIRPFVRESRPFTRNLRLAARDLAVAMPDLTVSFGELNRFFNIGAFNPNGAEGITGSGNNTQDRSTSQGGPNAAGRREGFLYWLAWVAQSGVGLHQNADARGPIRRVTLCTANAEGVPIDPVSVLAGLGGDLSPALFAQIVAAAQSAGLIDLLGTTDICPE